MARNVTEQELDALLARPDAPRPEVATRDFHEPRWLAPDELDALRAKARAAGSAVVESLTSALPQEVELDAVEAAEDTLDSVLAEGRAACVALVSESTGGPSLVTIDQKSALHLAELALGVGGATETGDAATHELSPLESDIVEHLLDQAFTRIAQAFGVTIKDTRFISDRAELARTLGSEGDRRRLAVHVAVAFGANKLLLRFLLSGVTPPPRKSTATARDKQAIKPALPADIGATRVELTAVLGELDVMLTDLVALEAGDLIPLSIAPGDPIVLRIEGAPCGRARFGERDGRLAVRLTEILRPSTTR